ncbi:MAG: flagellar M-ring protein FliF [Treponema sp.]|uniref:flagellar basal-body MS-ring/collar protein FliF n=1 Tax=Treponema sp. TaxID=166 RepID=UPI0025FE7EAD|nr:flagellar basal-body MS-ring/collar protein FliF [Treponema sp.]MBQ9624284.1 flagellar M-ring protein FliF [Treponema sp.]MBR0496466.1 flagellar M-ring protein FliF [Treponema sp.]
MNDWLKNTGAKLKSSWASWKPLQKAIAAGILIAVIVVLVLVFKGSSKPSGVELFRTPITDADKREEIVTRLEQENFEYTLNETTGKFMVADNRTAKKIRTLLTTEGILSSSYNIWDEELNVTNWSTTDFERGERQLQRVNNQIKQQLESLDYIANANVVINPKSDALMARDSRPAQASVILTIRGDTPSKRQIKGIQDLIMSAVHGLLAENVKISDTQGNILNDFEGMADLDAVEVVKKQQEYRMQLESKLSVKVQNMLQANFSNDRVRAVAVTIDMDMSKVTSDKTEYTPFTRVPDNPDTPYSELETVDGVPISEQTVTKKWTGTGYNPEGPAGVEGQNPPVYSDMSNVVGESKEEGTTKNYVYNTEQKHIEKAPSIDRITASANIDGYWEKELEDGTPVFATKKNFEALKAKYEEKFRANPQKYEFDIYPNIEDNPYIRLKTDHIVRIYSPVSDAVREQAASIVRDAIGYNRSRGDSVTITSWAIPREDDWNLEDDKILKAAQTRKTIMLVLIGVVVILVAFIIFRMISRELERRRRLREEELLRRQQAEREKALWDAKQEGMEVTMSVEERKRAELQENAIAMAKEHPEDVAMLIRTWMMEE